MLAKIKEYLKASIIILIIISLTFILNLPKDTLFTMAIIISVVIIFNEILPHDNNGGRNGDYITSIVFFIVFATFVYIFELPRKLYLFLGIIAVSFIILYELFNLIGDKEE